MKGNQDEDSYAGEILLKKQSDGTLTFKASDKSDNNGLYANAYRFKYYYHDSGDDTGYATKIYWLDIKLTKVSSYHAPQQLQLSK